MYQKYSNYLKKKYQEKVYKLPINLPITCPNRLHRAGCSFCAEVGTGFEAMDNTCSVTEQLEHTKSLIEKKYHARKFIAYFQNYTNTFMPLHEFESYMREAAQVDDIVEIAISTRPDCISAGYLDILKQIHLEYQVEIHIELGLQTVNYHTLDAIQRGHGLAEFLDAVLQIKQYGFTICVHLILNLPGDNIRDVIETAKIMSALSIEVVKLHSLYIAKNTRLCKTYEDGKIHICTKEEYFERVRIFLEYLSPKIVVERLFSRIPEEEAVFSNWNTSWWKLQEELLAYMKSQQSYQGKAFCYLNGAALQALKNRGEKDDESGTGTDQCC